MNFAENLRSELDYQGLIVKELAAKTGININTLNHYLAGNKTMPRADVAVKIASALGVTVEYLVTGNENCHNMTLSSLSPGLRSLIQTVEGLPEKDQMLVQKSALYLSEELKKREVPL
jgi:transcriptional regulator with XRE-family HTH domain